MDIVKLHFSKAFFLRDFKKECPDGGGIYLHYIELGDNNKRIIYVGECSSFKLRQEKHISYYDKNKYSLFDINKNGELDITYIPNYDSEKVEMKEMREKTISRIYVQCGIIEVLKKNTPSEIEGAIINELYRKSETRKYLLNTKTRWTLRSTEILFKGIECKYFGLKDKIIIP